VKTSLKALLAAAAALLPIGAYAPPAAACGGFFCSTAQPVNQAAERIVFANNGDGTVTAVIQIMYEGPSENFSWLLPISTAPMEGEIAVASDLAFQRLQAATNPQYTLTTRIEGTCLNPPPPSAAGGSPPAASGSPMAENPGPDGNVNVEASGSVGPFEWTVISVADGAEDPAQDAVTWLSENGYDVPESSPGLLDPYLEDGLFLLALRLTKGADTGSIRPIVLTYDADKPIIPVKLTSVAANDDMGVMTWLLGDGRGVPENYQALELNEARINWFNASSNYNDVVIEAANDAQGQGFVTEFAGSGETLSEVVWSSYEETQWQNVGDQQFSSFGEMFNMLYYTYGSFDGFWDAVQSSVTFTSSVTFEDFKLCPSCYSDEVNFSPTEFLTAIDANVIEPMRVVQKLIDSQPSVTRLYTTLSAEEMTIDPIFTFNPDLPDVSNLHTAERVIECSPELDQFSAPWRIELPSGGIIRGTAAELSSASSGTWPAALTALPANRTIRRLTSTGDGRLLEDNTEAIGEELAAYNKLVAPDAPATLPDAGGTGGDAGAAPAPSTKPTPSTPSASTPGNDTPDAGPSGEGPKAIDEGMADSGGCSVSSGAVSSGAMPSTSSWGWLGLASFAALRRRVKRANAAV
jgi:Uncharacterized protein conserved in bacteria (DUF2330)